MPPRVLALFVIMVLAPHGGWGADSGKSAADQKTAMREGAEKTAAATEAENGNGQNREVFSKEKYSELYEKHAPPKQELEDNPNVETLDEVVELEPYVVEGDGSLMMARFRRRWDLGTESIQKRVAELDESLGDQIQFSGRASDRFFSSQSPGSVRDRQEIFGVPTEQMTPVREVVGEVIDTISGRGK